MLHNILTCAATPLQWYKYTLQLIRSCAILGGYTSQGWTLSVSSQATWADSWWCQSLTSISPITDLLQPCMVSLYHQLLGQCHSHLREHEPDTLISATAGLGPMSATRVNSPLHGKHKLVACTMHSYLCLYYLLIDIVEAPTVQFPLGGVPPAIFYRRIR